MRLIFRYRGDSVRKTAANSSFVAALSLLAAALTGLGGCGGENEEGNASSGTQQPQPTQGAPFPNPSSRSLRELIRNLPRGPQLAPSVSLLQRGHNRFAFGLFDRGNKQIGDLKVALYVSRGLDETARGPFPARYERIEVKRPYLSKQAVNDSDAASSVYVSELPLRRAGGQMVAAVAELDDRLVASSPTQVMVSSRSTIPRVGQRAIRVHTPTTKSVAGDLSEIDTRTPPDSMHEVDLADALDRHRPVLLLFSSPGLCRSRACAYMTDVAEQVKDQYGSQVDFIHMEIYRENEVSKGLRPQVKAWHLRTDPWAFAINRRGIVVARLEGVFNVAELTAAVRKALG